MGIKVYCDICDKETETWQELRIAKVLPPTPWLCCKCYKKIVGMIKAATEKEPAIHDERTECRMSLIGNDDCTDMIMQVTATERSLLERLAKLSEEAATNFDTPELELDSMCFRVDKAVREEPPSQ